MIHWHHFVYKLGKWYCRLFYPWWQWRDKHFPPKEKAILFVAHPDDDTLFFHSFIKEHKPYVVLLFTGWSIKRLHDFRKAMRFYGVRWRAYTTVSSNACNNPRRRAVVEKHVRDCFQAGKFSLCATHNAEGEYGHDTHKLTHELVMSCLGDACPILCPVSPERIGEYPLSAEVIAEKEQIFKKIYTSELFVLDEYKVWFEHEKLECCSSK